jgi:iron complex outermembrane receptor protein
MLQADTAMAIHVITREDIRRSGQTSIPGLLRQVPGLQVAQINGNQWAVSARGFNGVYSNKLLVLVDGRSAYTPVFSGVYWDVQDTLLADIERIEVILGPGGSLWGANAVNGIINVVTRNSRETGRSMLQARGGSDSLAAGSLRVGGDLGQRGSYRAYIKTVSQGSLETAGGDDAYDSFRRARGGFRADWRRGEDDELTLQGEIYDQKSDRMTPVTSLSPPGNTVVPETQELQGGHLMARWERTTAAAGRTSLTAYFDRAERQQVYFDERIDTWDIEFQRNLSPRGSHEISWGLGYRLVDAHLGESFTTAFADGSKTSQLLTAYLHDEIHLHSDWDLALGAKFEHNDFSGFEWQPSIRLLWRVAGQHSLWGSVSRAVRTPARSDYDLRVNVAAFPGPQSPVLIAFVGSDSFSSEHLTAYELGYRARLGESASLDVAAFHNDYDHLLTAEPMPPVMESDPAPEHLLIPFVLDNLLQGTTRGIEVNAKWQPLDRLRIRAGYSYIDMKLKLEPESAADPGLAVTGGIAPRHQFHLHSRVDLPGDVELDATWYRVAEQPSVNLPGYSRVDLRIGWRLRDTFTLELSAQNLLDDEHLQFASDEAGSSVISRRIVLGFQLSL